MTKEIESAVDSLIASAGVTVTVKLIGATVRDKWACDEWRVTFVRGNVSESFEYFTGVGHRKAPKWQYGVDGFDNSMTPPKRGTLLYEKWQATAKPVAPHIAGVLYSLILDSEASNATFANWCDNFGYDSDSRKALATYEACQQNADKLANIFNAKERESLSEALQDY